MTPGESPLAAHFVATIGVFDGVHLGHKAVISTSAEHARVVNGTPVVVTFDPHPEKILRPEKAPHLLTATPHKIVLIRALGPSLESQGVTPALQNPVLKLMSGTTELRDNDDWQSESNSDDIVATTIPPSNPNEAAILVRLEPGPYTAVVTGADNSTGIALIEVYEIDHD